MPYLVISMAGEELERRDLKGALVLGRDPECDVCVPGPSVSRRHCRVEAEGDHWVVTDLSSLNGTVVGRKSIRRWVLADGDSFKVGEARVSFRAGALVGRSRPAAPVGLPAGEATRAAESPPAAEPPPSWMPHPRPRADDAAKAPEPAKVPQDLPLDATLPLNAEAVAPFALPFKRPPARPVFKPAGPVTPGAGDGSGADKTGSWLSSLAAAVGLSWVLRPPRGLSPRR